MAESNKIANLSKEQLLGYIKKQKEVISKLELECQTLRDASHSTPQVDNDVSDSLSSKVESLKLELSEKDTRLLNLTSVLQQKDVEINKLRKELEMANEWEKEEPQEEIHELNQRIIESTRLNTSLQTQLENANNKIQELTSELAKKSNSLENSAPSTSIDGDLLSQLQKAQSELSEVKEKLQTDLEGLKEEHQWEKDELEEKIQALERQVATAVENSKSSLSRVRQLEEELFESRERVKSLELSASLLRSPTPSSDPTSTSISTSISTTLIQEPDETEEAFQKLKGKLQTFLHSIEDPLPPPPLSTPIQTPSTPPSLLDDSQSLSSHLQIWQTERNDLQTQIQSLGTQAQSSSDQIRSLESRVSELVSDNQRLTEEKDSLEALMQSCSIENQSLTLQINQLQRDLQSVQESLTRKETECDQLSSSLSLQSMSSVNESHSPPRQEREDKVAVVSASDESSERTQVVLEDTIHSLSSEITDTESQLAERSTLIQSLFEQLKEIEEKNQKDTQDLRDQILSLQTQHQSELTNKDEALESQSSQIESLTQQIKSLETQLLDAQSSLYAAQQQIEEKIASEVELNNTVSSLQAQLDSVLSENQRELSSLKTSLEEGFSAQVSDLTSQLNDFQEQLREAQQEREQDQREGELAKERKEESPVSSTSIQHTSSSSSSSFSLSVPPSQLLIPILSSLRRSQFDLLLSMREWVQPAPQNSPPSISDPDPDSLFPLDLANQVSYLQSRLTSALEAHRGVLQAMDQTVRSARPALPPVPPSLLNTPIDSSSTTFAIVLDIEKNPASSSTSLSQSESAGADDSIEKDSKENAGGGGGGGGGKKKNRNNRRNNSKSKIQPPVSPADSTSSNPSKSTPTLPTLPESSLPSSTAASISASDSSPNEDTALANQFESNLSLYFAAQQKFLLEVEAEVRFPDPFPVETADPPQSPSPSGISEEEKAVLERMTLQIQDLEERYLESHRREEQAQQDLAAHSQAISDQLRTIAAFENEQSSWQEQSLSFKEQVSIAEDKIRSLEEELTKVQEDDYLEEEKSSGLRDSLNEANQRIAQLEMELVSAQESSSTLSSQVNSLREDLEAERSQLIAEQTSKHETQTSLDTLRNQLETKKTELYRLNELIPTLTSRISDLESQESSVSPHESEKEPSVSALEDQVRELDSQLQSAREEIEILNDRKFLYEDQISDLEKQVRSLTTTLPSDTPPSNSPSYSDQISQLTLERDSLQTQLSQLSDSHSSVQSALQQTIYELQTQLTETTTSSASFQSQIVDLISSKSQLESTISTLQSEIQTLRIDLQSLEAKEKHSAEKLIESEKLVKKLKHLAEKLKKECESLKTQHSESSQAIKSLESQLADCQAKSSAAENSASLKASKLEEQASHLSQQIQSLEEQLTEKTRVEAQLHSRITEIETESKKLKLLAGKLKQEYESTKSQLAASTESEGKLMDQMKELEDRVERNEALALDEKKKLNSEKQKLKQELEASRKSILSLEDDLKTSEGRVSDLQATIRTMEQTYSEETTKYNSNLEKLKKLLEASKASLAKDKSTIQNHLTEIEQLKDELAKQATTLSDAEEKISKLTLKLKTVLVAKAKADKANPEGLDPIALNDSLRELQTAHQELLTEAEELRSRAKTLSSELAHSKEEGSKLKVLCRKLKEEKEILTQRAEASESAHQLLEQDKASTLSSNSKEANDLKAQLKKCQSTLASMTSERDELQQRLSTQSQEHETKHQASAEKLERMKTLLTKAKDLAHEKKADLERVMETLSAPKNFQIQARLTFASSEGSSLCWCLVRDLRAAPETSSASSPPISGVPCLRWVSEKLVNSWEEGGSVVTGERPQLLNSLWVDSLASEVASLRTERDRLSTVLEESERTFQAYKTRAQTALKRVGVEDRTERMRLMQEEETEVKKLTYTIHELEGKISTLTSISQISEEKQRVLQAGKDALERELKSCSEKLQAKETQSAELRERIDGLLGELEAERKKKEEYHELYLNVSSAALSRGMGGTATGLSRNKGSGSDLSDLLSEHPPSLSPSSPPSSSSVEEEEEEPEEEDDVDLDLGGLRSDDLTKVLDREALKKASKLKLKKTPSPSPSPSPAHHSQSSASDYAASLSVDMEGLRAQVGSLTLELLENKKALQLNEEQTQLLKEHIRDLEASLTREKEFNSRENRLNTEYLVNVLTKFLLSTDPREREPLVPVLCSLLYLKPADTKLILERWASGAASGSAGSHSSAANGGGGGILGWFTSGGGSGSGINPTFPSGLEAVHSYS